MCQKTVPSTFHQTYVDNLLQQKHLWSIKSSLKFIYSRKQSQYLYLIPQISSFLSSCRYLHLIL